MQYSTRVQSEHTHRLPVLPAVPPWLTGTAAAGGPAAPRVAAGAPAAPTCGRGTAGSTRLQTHRQGGRQAGRAPHALCVLCCAVLPPGGCLVCWGLCGTEQSVAQHGCAPSTSSLLLRPPLPSHFTWPHTPRAPPPLLCCCLADPSLRQPAQATGGVVADGADRNVVRGEGGLSGLVRKSTGHRAQGSKISRLAAPADCCKIQ